MRVRVLYFGVLKDVMGHNRAEMELSEGSTVADLLAMHRGAGKVAGPVWDAIAVAVNQEYARVGDVLKDGDEVALLPPVSGGCEAKSKSKMRGFFPFNSPSSLRVRMTNFLLTGLEYVG